MDLIKEYALYIAWVSIIVSYILALFLSISIKNIDGKGWLISTIILSLITNTIIVILSIIIKFTDADYSIIRTWSKIPSLFSGFAIACFGLFLFSLWANKRINISIKDILFSFNGRISRASFWLIEFIIFYLIIDFASTAITTEAKGLIKTLIWIKNICSMIIFYWISLAIQVKRWHDRDKSGWMVLINLIPLIGFFWSIIELGFLQGTVGSNQYGVDTLQLTEKNSELKITENS